MISKNNREALFYTTLVTWKINIISILFCKNSKNNKISENNNIKSV